ncbi:helix-turn-helix transcriptional regulator [Microbispora bryophytorum]|uniref:helix-turn-helix transcriptional regulator n=1 Tax=Microbispora bryophytorum TaxID=1460882 RepID=UPI0033F84148
MPTRTTMPDGIDDALIFICVNYADSRLCLDMAAQVAGVSRFHFSRMFKARTGARFVEYLTRIRLAEASNRLLNTEDSVSSICYAVGYRDLSNFHRMFRRHYGTTPSAHRRHPAARGALIGDACTSTMADPIVRNRYAGSVPLNTRL